MITKLFLFIIIPPLSLLWRLAKTVIYLGMCWLLFELVILFLGYDENSDWLPPLTNFLLESVAWVKVKYFS